MLEFLAFLFLCGAALGAALIVTGTIPGKSADTRRTDRLIAGRAQQARECRND